VAGDGAGTDLMEKAGAMAETNLRPETTREWNACLKGTAVSRPKINLFLADFDCFATNFDY
jgi:hypothetical protein